MWQAIGNKLKIQASKIEEKVTAGGIVESAQVQETRPFLEATVISVGDKVKEPVEVNDKIMYFRSAAVPLSEDGVDYLIIDEEGLVCVWKEVTAA